MSERRPREGDDAVLTPATPRRAHPPVEPTSSAGSSAPSVPTVDLDLVLRRLDAIDARLDRLWPPAGIGAAIDDLRAQVELMSARLADLVGGPSLTDLQGSLDEVDRRLDLVGDEVRSLRRRTPLRAAAEEDAPSAPSPGPTGRRRRS